MRLSRAVLIAALFTATATTVARADTTLHPGDKVDVTVFNHPELSGTRTIDASGNVSLPVAGSVRAQNAGSIELASLVRYRLAPYVRNPAVQVKLDTQTADVFVSGGPSGVIAFAPGMTLGSAIAYLEHPATALVADANNGTTQPASGQPGLSGNALDLVNGPIDFRRVSVLRSGDSIGQFDLIGMRSTGEPGPVLEPSDTIQLVNKSVAVRIGGQVVHPGTAYLNPNEPLEHALTQVGGPSAASRIDQLELTRNGVKTDVSLGSPAFAQPAQNGDELIVPRAVHVDVLGNVEKPGDTMLRGSNTLVSAIYYAGGPSKFANVRAVQVIRNGVKRQYDLGRVQKGGSGDNPVLADGDIVFVPQGSTFQWSDVWSGLGALGLFGVHL